MKLQKQSAVPIVFFCLFVFKISYEQCGQWKQPYSYLNIICEGSPLPRNLNSSPEGNCVISFTDILMELLRNLSVEETHLKTSHWPIFCQTFSAIIPYYPSAHYCTVLLLTSVPLMSSISAEAVLISLCLAVVTSLWTPWPYLTFISP